MAGKLEFEYHNDEEKNWHIPFKLLKLSQFMSMILYSFSEMKNNVKKMKEDLVHHRL